MILEQSRLRDILMEKEISTESKDLIRVLRKLLIFPKIITILEMTFIWIMVVNGVSKLDTNNLSNRWFMLELRRWNSSSILRILKERKQSFKRTHFLDNNSKCSRRFMIIIKMIRSLKGMKSNTERTVREPQLNKEF